MRGSRESRDGREAVRDMEAVVFGDMNVQLSVTVNLRVFDG